MNNLTLAIALEALYQETTYFSRMVGRLVTREAWLLAHTRTLKNWVKARIAELELALAQAIATDEIIELHNELAKLRKALNILEDVL